MELSVGWKMRYENLEKGPEQAWQIVEKLDGWFEVKMPCDVHVPLIENGLIEEPLEGDGFKRCEWVEEKSWWFLNTFEMPIDALGADVVELVFEMLDSEADLWINGIHLGHHRSSFYPYIRDVRAYLRIGQNSVLVRLTCGLEHYSRQDTAHIEKAVQIYSMDNRGDARRPFVRKAQYTYGWDFAPRLATCGIMGKVALEPLKNIVVRSVHIVTEKLEGRNAGLHAEIEVENLKPWSTEESVIRVELFFGPDRVAAHETDLMLKSGLNFAELRLCVENVKLWWPNGMGEQPLYTVLVSVDTRATRSEFKEFKIGIRTLEIDMTKEKDGRRFTFVINGTPIFCKGGNWVPADAIYARVTLEKYAILIREAAEANFNMLRVWGGGIYERDIFYELCDEAGILIWHDFMFACALYPDDLEWFRNEVEKEIDWQTRRLRNHPSIALWSGCNENQWVYPGWWKAKLGVEFFGGASCYNILAPRIVRRNCPEIPYWNGSPYGGKLPNDEYTGDRHHWVESFMGQDMERRITPEDYDGVGARFVTEYGYVSPCCKTSTLHYLAGHQAVLSGRVWQSHTNWFEKGAVDAGICKHYTRTEGLELDDYLLYAGLCHGLMYQYSLEALRFKQCCSGGLFWMYSDLWGEVGWSILDYYLRRKIPYYFVKRALAHIRLILREEHGTVRILGANDSPEDVEFDAEYGYLSYDGKIKSVKTAVLNLKSRSREVVLEFDRGTHDFRQGCCFVRPLGENTLLESVVLRTGVFREMKLERPQLAVLNFQNLEGRIIFDISSGVYAHAVHFGLGDDVKLSDEYFDLLPGEKRHVEILCSKPDISVNDIQPYAVYMP